MKVFFFFLVCWETRCAFFYHPSFCIRCSVMIYCFLLNCWTTIPTESIMSTASNMFSISVCSGWTPSFIWIVRILRTSFVFFPIINERKFAFFTIFCSTGFWSSSYCCSSWCSSWYTVSSSSSFLPSLCLLAFPFITASFRACAGNGVVIKI